MMHKIYLIILFFIAFLAGFYFVKARFYQAKQAKNQAKVTALEQRQAVLEKQKNNLKEHQRHEKDISFRPRDELIDRLSDAGDLRD